jgi:DNA invertase Pin-like site-specific DNA recombinase
MGVSTHEDQARKLIERLGSDTISTEEITKIIARLSVEQAVPHFAIYLRVSSDPEGTKLAIARQLRDNLVRYLRVSKDASEYLPIVVYADNDTTAYDPYGSDRLSDLVAEDYVLADAAAKRRFKKARKAYYRMLGALRSNYVRAIGTWKTDRIIRSPQELEDLIRYINGLGRAELQDGQLPVVLIHSATEGQYDLTDSSHQFLARVLVAAAEKEVRDIIKRKRRKVAEQRQHGWTSARTPFGYRLGTVQQDGPVDRGEGLPWRPQFYPIAEERRALQEGAEAILVAGMSFGEVARRWNGWRWTDGDGVPRTGFQCRSLGPKARKAGRENRNKWTAATVANTLSSWMQCAVIPEVPGAPGLEPLPECAGGWEPNLRRDQVEAIRRLLDKRKTGPRTGPRHTSLLCGLLTCGVCGSKAFSRNKHRHSGKQEPHYAYKCNSAAKDQPELPPGVKPWHLTIDKGDEADKFVAAALILWCQEHAGVLLTRAGTSEAAILDAEAKIAEADRERAAIVADARVGKIDGADARALLAVQQQLKEDAQRQLDRLGQFDVLTALAQAEDAWQLWNSQLTLEEQRMALRLAMSEVVVYPASAASERPEHVPEGWKWCSGCKAIKLRGEFHNAHKAKAQAEAKGRTHDGKVPRCKTCTSERMKGYWADRGAGVDRSGNRGRRPSAVGAITIRPMYRHDLFEVDGGDGSDEGTAGPGVAA